MPRPEQKPVPPSIRQTYSCSHLIEFQHDTPKQMHTVTNEVSCLFVKENKTKVNTKVPRSGGDYTCLNLPQIA
ncbi:hypothetical protein QQG55_15025 [Brugia pahangi]